MNLLETMLHRRSVRKFNDTPLSQEEIDTIVKAGLSSPSGHAYYPCELIVVTDKQLLSKLEGTRVGGGTVIANSTCTIFVIGDKEKSETWIEDSSIILSNMHLMADYLGLGSCWIQSRCRNAADNRPTTEFVKDILNYSSQYELLGALAIGHIDEHPGAHDEAFIDGLKSKVHYNGY